MLLQKYKIVFGGKMGAGKTQAIQSISEVKVLSTEAQNTDLDAHAKALTTVGIDYGEIKLEDEVIGEAIGYSNDRFDEEDQNVITEVEEFVEKHCEI